MNAVWLNDELMVSPGAVAGVITQSEDDSWGKVYGLSRWVSVVLLGGDRVQVWIINADIPIGSGGEALRFALAKVRAEQKALAEAEMERLSALLWPPEAEKSESVRCGSVPIGAGYRCELNSGHGGLHEGFDGWLLHHWGVGGEQSPT